MTDFEQVIVRTKLTPPVNRRRKLIRRQRLVNLLTSGELPKLTVVTAPAGYGKTSLLYQWYDAHRHCGHRVGWLSLDPQDILPSRFLRHFIWALQPEGGGFGESALRYLDTAHSPDVRVPISSLINEIFGVDGPAILFLDDYHLADSREIDEFIDHFLNLAPMNFHLVISSRLLPRLSLPEMRLRDELLELDAQSLQFDKAESFSFLSMDERLDDTAIELLYERSEGWIAGLQLASAALRNTGEARNLTASFTGTLRDISDYLAKAVLENQSREIRDFLLVTGVLDRFNADLCAYVTGNILSPDIIEQLERNNLFVVPLDQNRDWFRYHHLFQEFLLHTSRRVMPERQVDIYRRAADWSMARGHGADAVDYALLAGDLDRAAHMAESHALNQIEAGYMPEMARWLTSLPDELNALKPELLSIRCLCLWHIFQQEEANAVLGRLENVIRTGNDGLEGARRENLENEMKLHRAGSAVCAGYEPDIVLSLLDEVNPDLLSDFCWAVFYNVSGIAKSELSRFDDAFRCFRSAYRRHRELGSPLGVACSYYLEALMEFERGNLNSIEDLLERVQEESVFKRPAAGYIYPSMLHCVAGLLNFERGDIATAQRLLEANLDLAVEVGHLKMVTLVLVSYARLLSGTGKEGDAIAQLDTLASHLKRNEPDSSRAMILADYERVRLALLSGNLMEAQEIVARYGVDLGGPAPTTGSEWARLPLLSSLAWCRAQLAAGRGDEALEPLEKIASLAWSAGRKRRFIEARLLKSLALNEWGEQKEALQVFRRILVLAEEEGLVRLIADEGKGVLTLLGHLVEAGEHVGVSPAFLEKIRGTDRESRALSANLAYSGAASTITSFSEKEKAILALVATGNSNSKVAERLDVTTHTVKWHLSNIFTKLQVKNRTAAVSAAKAMKVI